MCLYRLLPIILLILISSIYYIFIFAFCEATQSKNQGLHAKFFMLLSLYDVVQ